MRLSKLVAVDVARKSGIPSFVESIMSSFGGANPRATMTAGVEFVKIACSRKVRTFGSSSRKNSISCLPITRILAKTNPFKYPVRLRPGRCTSALLIRLDSPLAPAIKSRPRYFPCCSYKCWTKYTNSFLGDNSSTTQRMWEKPNSPPKTFYCSHQILYNLSRINIHYPFHFRDTNRYKNTEMRRVRGPQKREITHLRRQSTLPPSHIRKLLNFQQTHFGKLSKSVVDF